MRQRLLGQLPSARTLKIMAGFGSLLVILTIFLWLLYPAPLLVFSIPIRLAACLVAVAAALHWRDWRVLPLALMFFLMAMRQVLTLLIRGGYLENTFVTQMLSEIPGFIVTLLAFSSIVYTWRLFAYRQHARQADRRLRESEEKFRLISEFSNDWEYWIDREGQYLFLSPSFEKITGYPVGDFHDERTLIERIVHPDEQRQVAAISAAAQPAPTEFRIFRRDGQLRWIHNVAQPVYNNQGQWVGIRGSNHDVTELKLLRDEVSVLQGIIPICSSCKRVREDSGYWTQVEQYLTEYASARFSHSLCPQCVIKLYPDLYHQAKE
jgi:PAS domain S-box-containing protein